MTFQHTYTDASGALRRRMYEQAGLKFDEAAAIRQVESMNSLFAKAEGLHTQRAAVIAEGQAAARGLIPAAAPSVVVTLSPEATARLATDQATTVSGATPEASPAQAATTYAKGTVESENVQMAVGMSQAARTNIETLNLGVSVYNGAMRDLNDTAKFDKLVADGKSHIADVIVYINRRSIKFGLQMASGALGKMSAEFTVTGTPVAMAANGALKTGDYVQSKEEGGWSVSVKSTGEVKATANGADVSGQVSDSSSSGFKWSDIIAKRQNAKATADEVALKTLTYAATQADLARAEAKKDEKTDAPATVSAISAGQIALQALTQGRTLDTSA